MVTKMDPFLMIRKNDTKKEKQFSWPKILSRLRKPKKQQISPLKIKLDNQYYELLLEGQQNFQIFDDPTEIQNMYIIQGKEEPLSLSGHINTFIKECQNNKLNPKENQSLLFENCKLVFKKEDDSRVYPLVIIMPEKDQIPQNQQNLHISPQQKQRRVHFSSIKNKNTDQSTQMQTQPFRVEGRRHNKNSIILKGKFQTEDVLQNLAQLQQQQQQKIPKYPQDFTTKRVYEDKIKEIEMQNTHKDFILASVSHDFKTPINGMLALLNALLRTHQNSDNILHLEIIRKNIFLLLYMIADIQDYSKLQDGQLRMNPSRCNIQDIVLDVIELMTIQAQQKKIDLRYQLDMQSYELRSDQNRIKQVLFNLVSNALKFTMRGYILIKIIQDGPNIIKISVSDTGVGIPDCVKSKLFKLNATFDQKGLNKDGVGLGLVICQNIVHQLGPLKEIQIESIQNVGTTFSFYLYINVPDSKQGSIMVNSFVQFNSKPDGLNFHSSVYLFSKKNIQTIQKLNDVERISDFPEFNENRQSKSLNDEFYNSDDRLNDQQNQVVKNITQHQIVKGNQKPLQNYDNYDSHIKFVPQQKINIMVVDDEPFNVYAFRIMCASQDINLHEAYNGQEAVAKLKTQADIGFYYDFIFLDLTMPIMNGYQAAEAILNMIQKEQIKPLHLVAISGYDDIKEKETCLNLGFDAFISKPVEFEYLRQIIGEISPQRKQSQQ